MINNYFGSVPIDEIQTEIIARLLHKFTDYEASTEDPVYFKDIDGVNGILTDVQWDMADHFAVPKDMKPSIMTLVRRLNKKSISSIQKPRDMARKKIIESFITVALILSDPAYLEHFINEVL